MKTAAAIVVGSLAAAASALSPVTVKGNAFFAGSKRFYVRGVDYQPGGDAAGKDPIADVTGCKRDVAEFKKLGINTVRVYTVDNTANHDECMSMLADAGIYLALDVNNKAYSINRAEPKQSYNDVYLQSVFATIDAFQKYDNTLLFFSGNEVINDNTTTGAAPYVKATTRDMRQYIGSRNYRKIPVGYSAADVEENRYEMATYMNCGTADERSDFFAFNDYSWCDPSSYTQSGWNAKVAQYGNYSIPLFLSEYGCIKGVRKFEEVAALYGPQMTPVYSGGLVYEYSQEASNYGLVEVSGDSSSVKERPDFDALQSALEKTPAPSGDGGYKSSGEPSTCPPQSDTWDVSNDDLPAIPSPALKYMQDGAGKGPGLTGPGSQDAGVESSGTATAGSGAVTATSSHSGAAGILAPDFSMAPFACALVLLASTFLGAATML
ncbi:1,3-beta-glucanosyltransferase [Rhizodiscina lignyota]|uniref:1,3-beta-glucanosyltransferase n=1 Tax=Rhizodiscina lignyota TaxID=1504668 RepID=A0A9P4IR49_9PEZI|nr:1,3-beta-glucanosyltransferase [Rhizodiscina lignyota]